MIKRNIIQAKSLIFLPQLIRVSKKQKENIIKKKKVIRVNEELVRTQYVIMRILQTNKATNYIKAMTVTEISEQEGRNKPIDKILENDIYPITSGIRDEYDFFIAGTIMAICSVTDDFSDEKELMGLVHEIIGKFIYMFEMAWQWLDSKENSDDDNIPKANPIIEPEVDTTNLEAGMFLPKGYRELCILVNEKPLKSGSNSYKAQLKRWARYFKMEKGRGRSLVILDV